MIVCPNCAHQNPEGATQCEACYTPLPAMVICPSCGASNQGGANFCGQCGYDLSHATNTPPTTVEAAESGPADLESLLGGVGLGSAAPPPLPSPIPVSSEAVTVAAAPGQTLPVAQSYSTKTQLQQLKASLLHVRSNVVIELPQGVGVVHVGKPNDRVPPDVDVSGFQDSEVVSRIHADIRVEGDAFYIEDVGSANGTYVNNLPLPRGNRHRLRPGDRLSFGKGDLVTFLFQMS